MPDRSKNESSSSREARAEQVKQAAVETVQTSMAIVDEFILNMPAETSPKEKLDYIFTQLQNFSEDMRDDPSSRAFIGMRKSYDLIEGEDPGVFMQINTLNSQTNRLDTLNISVYGGTNSIKTEDAMRNMADSDAAFRRGQHHTVRTEAIADRSTLININLNDGEENIFMMRFLCNPNGKFVGEVLTSTGKKERPIVDLSSELPNNDARDLFKEKVSPMYQNLMKLRDRLADKRK